MKEINRIPFQREGVKYEIVVHFDGNEYVATPFLNGKAEGLSHRTSAEDAVKMNRAWGMNGLDVIIEEAKESVSTRSIAF